MKKRIKLQKRNKNFVKNNKITITIILIIIFIFYWFFLLNKEASPILSTYAELETTKLATVIINKAVSNQVSNEMSLDDLIITTLNDQKEIISVDFDTVNVNKALNSVTNTVEVNLRLLEEGKLDLVNRDKKISEENLKKGIIYQIPFGAVTKNPIIADLGPKIPVKVKMVGSVISNIKTKITNYGINNALLEVYIEVEVSEQVILPFISKRITISQDIPVSLKIIQGTVPKYYGGSIQEKSNIFSIPIENEDNS